MKRYLDSNHIEIKDLTGQSFDYGMNIEVIHNDMPKDADDQKAIISETLKPMILQNGVVVCRGQVVIGLKVKTQEVLPEESNKKIDDQITKKEKTDFKWKEKFRIIQKNLKEKVLTLCFPIMNIVFIVISSICLNKISISINENGNNLSQLTTKNDNISVCFVYDDTNEIVERCTYNFGDKITIPDSIMNRPCDNTYTYNLSGWINEPKNAEKNEIYRAVYTKNYINYEIIFNDYDGTEISKATYHYDDNVKIPANPIRQNYGIYKYIFNGWDKEVTNVKESTTYTATYIKLIEYFDFYKNQEDINLLNENNYFVNTINDLNVLEINGK